MPFSLRRTLVAISDFREGWPPARDLEPSVDAAADFWRQAPQPLPDTIAHPEVRGGYLERLPLACIRAGLVDRAEVWHHLVSADPETARRDDCGLVRRAFRISRTDPPFSSNSMRGFVKAFGAPRILCVWGLGVDEALLDACADSFKIYNSIDAPALRVPDAVSGRFDLVLTASEWQSDEVRARHPAVPCAVLPIGPEFADPDTFRPLGIEKPYDAVYVAAAQPYKRHDLFFDALAQAPRRMRALCVFGYGEMADELRRQAEERNLDVDFVGPPGVGFTEVNRLMNLAKVGVVCGVDDGAPAILTEYMLAGLPVLANAGLRCGLQYILPAAGRTADESSFAQALARIVEDAATFSPRETVLSRWTWPHSVARLMSVMADTPKGRTLGFDIDH
ncbi:glycosyltransferase family 4 protein [Lichenifustis flavocetrariae]|uniref:Glycosyltransferase family 4 protein n=1 Tax=Lichenifustis flavocetrariae TaxID=2949735 RepID=A0AA41YRZ7_9HYPH|nr:glycosyltransferase family 4 protein [Lichenifustis flavocetrariae]MCW6507484.1 glycosyltransferase family 4 protein [Lichenifustis flavocetrariae]